MAKELRRMPFDEFAANLAHIFDRVVRENETVAVEKDDDVVIVRPKRSAKRRPSYTPSAADYEAFLASAGGWRDMVDTDQLKEDIYESRRISSRPPVTV